MWVRQMQSLFLRMQPGGINCSQLAGKSSWQSLEGKLKRQLTEGKGREEGRERERGRGRMTVRSAEVSYAGDRNKRNELYICS